MQNYQALTTNIGYSFNKEKLLQKALTHPSISNISNAENYEVLELLGDAVLSLIATEKLISLYPDSNEGDLVKRRSSLICKTTLAEIAKEIGIGQYINMTFGEESSGGRNNRNILENVLEALIGAIYMDGGYMPASNFFARFWNSRITTMDKVPKDPKSKLQEWSQSQGMDIPNYMVISREGSAHAPVFTIEVTVNSNLTASASGKSKKEAETFAAQKLIEQIEKNNE
jgi:ribonuclease III